MTIPVSQSVYCSPGDRRLALLCANVFNLWSQRLPLLQLSRATIPDLPQHWHTAELKLRTCRCSSEPSSGHCQVPGYHTRNMMTAPSWLIDSSRYNVQHYQNSGLRQVISENSRRITIYILCCRVDTNLS